MLPGVVGNPTVFRWQEAEQNSPRPGAVPTHRRNSRNVSFRWCAASTWGSQARPPLGSKLTAHREEIGSSRQNSVSPLQCLRGPLCSQRSRYSGSGGQQSPDSPARSPRCYHRLRINVNRGLTSGMLPAPSGPSGRSRTAGARLTAEAGQCVCD